MKKLLLILLCLPILVLSQTEQCGTMEYLEYLKAQDPQLEQRMEQDEIDLQSRLQNQPESSSSTIITIPVVVHIVYNNANENISDAQIQSQLTVLNQDFRRLNADASSTPLTFQSVAADIEVEFCLASQDPNGQPTTGITRTSTSQSPFSTNDGVKYSSSGGTDAWNTSDYLNIWVCDLSSLLGYAQSPNTGISNTDGVVCDYAYFGNIGTANAPYDLGRTATHEVGHWLNLRHIWGDATCGDDFCNDTPTQETQNYNCQSFPHVTCNNGPNGDMFMNYMDYSYDACMNMFTEDQKTRMIDAINTHRTGLLTSNGCSTGGCTSVLAYNYDPSAGIDDGSCCFLAGCTDPAAYNYNVNVCEDDASCVYAGCPDPAATNYSSIATIDDSSCVYAWMYGCTEQSFWQDMYTYILVTNYDSNAIYNDGSCEYIAYLDGPGFSLQVSGITITACDIFVLSQQQEVCYWEGNYFNYSTIYIANPGIYMIVDYDNTCNSQNDSLAYIDVKNSTSSTINITTCDSYNWNGNTYTTSGTYTDVIANVAGCDSTLTLNLTINNSTTYTSHAAACDSYTWNGNAYTTSGLYYHNTLNSNGCDNTEILVLTINSSTSNSTTQTACDTYTWSVDGNTYSTSGTYTDVSTNAVGCDHSETLELTINNSVGSTDTHIACDEFMWNCDGNLYTSSNNTATYVYSKADGCDSTVTLNLTINSSTSNSTTQTACDTYTWSVDGNTYLTSGTYTDVSTNAAGCDHTEELNLSISTVIASIDQEGDSLFAVTTPIGLIANWYNIQTEDSITRIWLMESNSSTYTPGFDCSYFIIIEDDNGCVDTSAIFYYGANASRIGSLITSPNPTSGFINVKFENPNNQFVKLDLINSNGAKLDEFMSKDTQMNLDISKYPSGIYYIYFDSLNRVQGCLSEKKEVVTNKIILNK